MAFAAAMVQGLLGFGFTLVAISFFLALIGPAAVQLIIVINLVTTVFLAVPLWRHVPLPLWKFLVGGSLLGLPIGIVAYGVANVTHLQIGAGVFVVTFASLAWFDVSILPSSAKRQVTHSNVWSLAVGAISGFMATSLGMPGPILVLYLAGLELEKDVIRGTAVSFLAVMNVVALLFHTFVFNVETEVIVTAFFLLPIAVAGTWGGHQLSSRLGQRRFRHALLFVITGSGAYAVFSAFG